MLIAQVTAAEPRDKATRCDWLVATTQVVFARTLVTKVFECISNKSLADSIFESARLLLFWSGQQKNKRFSRPAYINNFCCKSANHPTYNKSWLMYAGQLVYRDGHNPKGSFKSYLMHFFWKYHPPPSPTHTCPIAILPNDGLQLFTPKTPCIT